jgi:nucleoside-diphosphate-sugar epimerase
MRIAVTGSSGKLGSAAVARLRLDGHSVTGFDVAGAPGPGFTRVDFLDYGQTIDALQSVTARHDGFDALVHLAAIPVNGMVPDVTTFHSNMGVTFNVFHGAMRAGIRTIVAASSITALGFPFTEPPEYLPLDEAGSGRANNTYGLVKVLEEELARQLVRWDEQLSVTALRFTNVTLPGEYAAFVPRAGDPQYRRDLIWSYVDARDGAEAIALALAHARPGFENYNIAASDTGLTVPSADLMAAAFPGVPCTKPDLGTHETLMGIDKARRQLGFEPRHLWRDEAAAEGA